MDSEKIIIYILIGIVYYGYRYFFKNFGKSTNTPPPIAPPSPVQTIKEAKPKNQEAPEKSIFDLLEEIKRQGDRRGGGTMPEKTPSLETDNYELEPQKLAIESVYSYGTATTSSASISPVSRLYDAEEYPTQKKPHPLLNSLKDVQKVKEAFILGEILAKRY